ncbi:TPA: DUF2187 family protein [Bacillus cereus]|nr:DUF2187 family protein [Bacillus cereus]
MGKINNLKIGEYVQFSYRDNPSIQLTGYIVRILNNTIVVDIGEIAERYSIEETRQVIKHGNYKQVIAK